MFELRKEGATRLVILTQRWAIKVPAVHHKDYRWEGLLHGLLSNINERKFSRIKNSKISDYVMPTVFSVWGGFLNIQPRGRELTEEEFDNWCEGGGLERWEQGAKKHLGFRPPVERKRSSFVARRVYRTEGRDPVARIVHDRPAMLERVVAIDLGTNDHFSV